MIIAERTCALWLWSLMYTVARSGRPAVLGGILHQPGFAILPELSVPGIFLGQAIDAFHHKLSRPAREIEHEFGRHPEAISYLLPGISARLISARGV